MTDDNTQRIIAELRHIRSALWSLVSVIALLGIFWISQPLTMNNRIGSVIILSIIIVISAIKYPRG